MENCSKLLCVVLVMYCMIRISTSSCQLIETNQLEAFIGDALQSQEGEDGNIFIEVSEMNINCQAVGNLRDTYNYLTITARYERLDNNNINVGQILLECDDISWSYDDLNDISGTNEQSALLTGNTSTNCFMCGETCDECDSACDRGLGFCTGGTNTSCCSFYDNNECVSQCGTNKHSNESFDCVCNQFYSGSDCTNCLLQQSDCQNGGSLNLATCSCDCTTGYMSQTCNEDINECETDDPCIYSISCTNTNGSYVCDCMSGFTGTNCETNIDDCMSDSCLHNSTCIDDINNFTCQCADGYEGPTCETNIDDCSPNPCKNDGTCTDDIDSYTCVCTDQYTGPDCDDDVNECEDDPCNNGGTCTNNNGGFECTCNPGWTGSTCTMDIDECSPNPCMNGGNCTDGIDNYNCSCTDQYTGRNCNEDVNECENDEPCLNGGTCSNSDGGFNCRCQGRWAGALCSTCVIDDCREADCDGRDFECLECNEGYKPSPNGDECIACTIPSCTSCSTRDVCSSCEEGLVTDRDGSACASPIPPRGSTSGELSVGIIFGIIIVLGVLIAIVVTVIVVVAVISLRIRAKKPIQHKTKDPGDSKDPIVLTKISHL